jgi:hypothetical protein
VHDVVVAGAAREAEPAGDGQRPVGLVESESQFGGADLHRRREAGVEVDVGDVVDADARQRQRGPARETDGR